MAILALALIVLGPQRLPEAVRTVGRVVGELRRISSGFQEELRNALDDSEVERDLDRLRGTGDGRDGADQRELPLTDQPELPLGAVQYPSGYEPIDVDPRGKAPGAGADEGKDPAIDDDPPPFEPAPYEPAVEPQPPDDLDAARAAAEPAPAPAEPPEAAPGPETPDVPAAAAADAPVVTSEGAGGNGGDEGGPEAPVEAEAPGAGPERNGS